MKKRKILVFIVCLLSFSFVLGLSACNRKTNKTEGTLDADYNVFVSLCEETNSLYIKEDITIVNNTSYVVDELQCYVYANAYESMGGKFIVGSVKQEESNLEYSMNDVNLSIKLLAPICANESTVVTLQGTVKIPGGDLRFAKTVDGDYNFHGFFPRLAVFDDGTFQVVEYSNIGDPYYFNEEDFNITIEYPNQYTLAHSGLALESIEKEKITRTTINIDSARDIALSLSKKYQKFESDINGIKIAHYTSGEDMTPFISKCVTDLSNIIGEFPYRSLSVVETAFQYGGMEYSGMVIINKDVRDKEYVVCHEIIHQWFGLKVGSNSFKECWVDESLTNFLSYYYICKANNIDLNAFMQKEKEYYKSFVEYSKEENGEGYVPKIAVSLKEFLNMEEYSEMVYGYGALMYHNIMEVVGEQKFIKGVSTYYDEYASKNATADDVVTSFSRSCGKKVKALFRGYLDLNVIF